MSIIDLIKHLTVKKTKWEDLSIDEQNDVNIFMFNKWISMNNQYVEIVDDLQEYTLRLSKEMAYKLYLEILPKSPIYFKYVKPNPKVKYPTEILDAVIDTFRVNWMRAYEYLLLLNNNDIYDILKTKNLDDKTINKLIDGIQYAEN